MGPEIYESILEMNRGYAIDFPWREGKIGTVSPGPDNFFLSCDVLADYPKWVMTFLSGS